MRDFLVIRFSAMGDVLLTLPVLVQATEQNPDVRFIVLTRPKFAVFFEGYDRISVYPADVDKEFKGFLGLWRLVARLKSDYDFEAILDLHEHLRSKIIKRLFFGLPKFTLEKGRADKKALTRKENKQRKDLPHACERYAKVLHEAGIVFELKSFGQAQNYFRALPVLPFQKKGKWVGLAPFAQHEGKIWPFEKIDALIQTLPSDFSILLFGGGAKEVGLLKPLAEKYANVVLVAGQFALKTELSLISALDAMLCMDSSNMHMAALAGVPTVSIWGATHRQAGFGPFGNQGHRFVEISTAELPCRPCSVYGNKPCFREDYACLNRISPAQVSQELIAAI
ncbi:glycosyltransferase family 9 protein [Marinilongibacter aquaticus]|uniref:glycosyltransferase family 9 protein n=1 Tax=Marinilongibacter aquaticus TaxID=2975157 RepID=UPI0021BDC607|nr:glycosyltransferase family 9 protein [Marinilongibacter aquaticus]UBM58526.1 glycosyltransferase family 9 protein [Marinilongibacter aquaticus]